MNPVRLVGPTVGEIKRLLAEVPDDASFELLNRTSEDMIVSVREAEWLTPREDDSAHGSFVLVFCEVPARTFYRWLMHTSTAQEFMQLEEVFNGGEPTGS